MGRCGLTDHCRSVLRPRIRKHRQVRIFLGGFKGQRNAVKLRHDNIGQQHVILTLSQRIERLLTIADRGNIVAVLTQRPADEFTYRPVILGE